MQLEDGVLVSVAVSFGSCPLHAQGPKYARSVIQYHFTESDVLEPACEAAQGSRFYMA